MYRTGTLPVSLLPATRQTSSGDTRRQRRSGAVDWAAGWVTRGWLADRYMAARSDEHVNVAFLSGKFFVLLTPSSYYPSLYLA